MFSQSFMMIHINRKIINPTKHTANHPNGYNSIVSTILLRISIFMVSYLYMKKYIVLGILVFLMVPVTPILAVNLAEYGCQGEACPEEDPYAGTNYKKGDNNEIPDCIKHSFSCSYGKDITLEQYKAIKLAQKTESIEKPKIIALKEPVLIVEAASEEVVIDEVLPTCEPAPIKLTVWQKIKLFFKKLF